MSCLINAGYTKGCDIPAGIRKLFFINYSEIDAITKTNGAVTTLTLDSGKTAYVYNVDMELTNFSEKSIGNRENGSYGYEQSISTILHGNNQELSNLMDILTKARIVAIAELNNGTYELLFEELGAKFAIERVVEEKYDGLNGYKLSATHRQSIKSCTVDPTVITALPKQ